MSSKPVSIIVAALLPSFGIGSKGTLPWKLRKEMKYFRNVTSKVSDPTKINAVVMGRKTWESIPEKFRPLPNRYNVIITRQDLTKLEKEVGVSYENEINDALIKLQKLDHIEKIFIIGGAEIYNSSIITQLVNNLLITEIKHSKNVEVEMDTYLNKEYILNNFEKRTKDELQSFIGDMDLGETETIVEGDFEYQYEFYTRK
ncbi:hypothetical protein WICMUC_000225 [Wickerhamomyces mucosus]|uniref:Dihydrofolate reductase n=1 Tax=Wickerhamomyces mucosus TaxID=1378264 RepID=A0A9P8PYG0_9ASCO|nr:hypothetical protein WICMUC_000225 [Wickerhamomyces mucosus]